MVRVVNALDIIIIIIIIMIQFCSGMIKECVCMLRSGGQEPEVPAKACVDVGHFAIFVHFS